MGLDHALRPFLQDSEVHQSNFPLPEDQRENAPRPLESISTTDRSQLDDSQISSRLTKRSLRLREPMPRQGPHNNEQFLLHAPDG